MAPGGVNPCGFPPSMRRLDPKAGHRMIHESSSKQPISMGLSWTFMLVSGRGKFASVLLAFCGCFWLKTRIFWRKPEVSCDGVWWQHVWQKFSITDILMAGEMQILRSFPWEFEFSIHSPYFLVDLKNPKPMILRICYFSRFFSKCIHRDVTHWWVKLVVFRRDVSR